MIVYKNKRYIKCELFPNSDWIGDADWVLNDETDVDLENKIIDLYPNFDFVLDGNGNIIDVVEIKPTPTPLNITLEQRVTAVENATEEIINIIMEV